MEPVNSINDMTLNQYPSDDDMIRELDDGSVIVPDPESAQADVPRGHLDNLALFLPENRLNSIASELIDLIEKDKRSGEDKDELYEEGIKKTGMSKESDGGATFEGASRAVHPVLAEACVDYASATIREIFPPEGPVKMQVLSSGNAPDSIEKSENKRDYMNWQLTNKIVEYKSELEILFSQQPYIGSQYMKFWYDESRKRIRAEFIPSDKVIIPYASSSLIASSRFTLSSNITQYELERRVRSGLYRDLRLTIASIYPDETAAEKASHAVEGKTQESENTDGLREILEVYVYYDVEDKGEFPYIISIDVYEEKILSIYRNWDEVDTTYECLEWVVEFPFIPWRGAGGVGLTHLIGSLSGAATGALRALLDSAHINNFPGAIKLKGAKSSGQNVRIGPTEIVEIEAPANADDVRKVIMPLPFNQPSQVLMALLGLVVDAAKGVVSTAEEKIADATNQMPVGTAMALIEQGSKVFSAIHARQHEAQKRCLNIIQRLNSQYLDVEEQQKVFGKVLVTPEDFLYTNNVIPVSDPNIFSESQRFAQTQGILQMSQDTTVQWNKHAIYMRLLRLMHVDNPQEFLPPLPQPVSADPITEIVAAMNGQQVQAQPDMDHMWHLSEHLWYILDPIFGAANPTLMNPGFQTVMQDINQHMLYLFQQLKNESYQQVSQSFQQMLIVQLVQAGLDGESMVQIIQQQMSNPEIQQQIRSQAYQLFQQREQGLSQLVQMQQKAAELVKTKVPKPQMSEQSQAAIEVARMQEETKIQIAQLRDQGDKAKFSIESKLESQKQDLDRIVELQVKPSIESMKQEVEIRKNSDDNSQKQMTDLQKNSLDNETELEKNERDNRTTILINQMREEAALERATLLEQMRLQFQESKAANEQTSKIVQTILSKLLDSSNESKEKENASQEGKE